MSAATVQQALDLALSDLRAGRLQAVEANCRQILAKFPDQPDAMHMLAVVAHRVGRTDVAIDLLRRAVAVAPSHLEILRTLGSILITSGNFEPAIVFFGQAVRIAPNDAEILNNLGTALQETGQIQSAAEAFSRAVACQPEMAEAHLNLGGACAAAGDIKKAVDCFRRALAINPDLVPALNNLGTALMELDDFDGAVSLLERAVEVDPNLPQAHNNLGLALDHQNQPDRAIAEFQHAIALQPQYAEAHNNLGTVLMNIGDPSAAATEFANALKASPRHAVAHSNFIYSLNFSPDTTPHRILEEQKKWEQLQTKREWVDGRKFSNDRSRDRRLRVGLVSADFREHVAGWNLLPILREHDRQKLALICYSNLKNPDVMTERMRGEVEGWRSIAGMEDGRAVEMLVGDQIDVLIDLSMHSAGNRLGVFARRAAPVQMTYLGYCGSTGLSTMDYRLSDPYLDDAQTEKDYVEKTLYLPQTYWCYSPGGEVPEVSEPPMKRKGYITFGCLNNFAKMSVWVQELWSRWDAMRRPAAR